MTATYRHIRSGLLHSDLKPGDHAWAMYDGKLMVVMRVRDGYEVCGPWECGIGEDGLELVQRIDRPKGAENVPLYYL